MTDSQCVKKTVLRLCLSLTETFSNLIACTVINKHGKSGVIQISALFDPIYHFTCPKPLKLDFWEIYLTTFFGLRRREENLWEQKTCDRLSMCSQTVWRFCILLRKTFSDSIAFTVINKYAKGAAVEISTVFDLIYHAAFPRVFRNGTF